MKEAGPLDAVDRARAYYDSPDADEFYFRVWGGEDIHIGIYKHDDEPIADASRRTVRQMANQLGALPRAAHILDIGSGYGGSARHLAREYGFRVTCLNLSTVQNERNRQRNAELGLQEMIQVVDGNFEELPFAGDSFDAVWSQDAILHSSDRLRVLDEVGRVLKRGGSFLFTDPMQSDTADPSALRPVLDRIHLDSLGSFGFYRRSAAARHWETVSLSDLSYHLPTHYGRVKMELEARDAELDSFCSRDYRERMKAGLQHWIDAGRLGHLAWGILHFKKKRG
jgi:ubiquinone/menaquinone biosynthesis C-methylase UbiE